MNKKVRLITETSYNFELVEDSKSKDLYIAGIFSSADIVNSNNRKYKKPILEREVNKISEKLNKKSLWGELGHPNMPEVNPDRIAILTTQLEWKENNLFGKAKILETPMGNIAKTLIREGNMGISSRGLGTVDEDGFVNEDFQLITWDMVTDPSNSPSWVSGIYEGQTFDDYFKKEPTIEDAKEYLKRKIWQVIEDIDKNL